MHTHPKSMNMSMPMPFLSRPPGLLASQSDFDDHVRSSQGLETARMASLECSINDLRAPMAPYGLVASTASHSFASDDPFDYDVQVRPPHGPPAFQSPDCEDHVRSPDGLVASHMTPDSLPPVSASLAARLRQRQGQTGPHGPVTSYTSSTEMSPTSSTETSPTSFTETSPNDHARPSSGLGASRPASMPTTVVVPSLSPDMADPDYDSLYAAYMNDDTCLDDDSDVSDMCLEDDPSVSSPPSPPAKPLMVSHLASHLLEYVDEEPQSAEVFWDFMPREKDELALKAGDVITVTDSSDADWWWGRINHRKGRFPAIHVEVLEYRAPPVVGYTAYSPSPPSLPPILEAPPV